MFFLGLGVWDRKYGQGGNVDLGVDADMDGPEGMMVMDHGRRLSLGLIFSFVSSGWDYV